MAQEGQLAGRLGASSSSGLEERSQYVIENK
jgi:hypothetical protein